MLASTHAGETEIYCSGVCIYYESLDAYLSLIWMKILSLITPYLSSAVDLGHVWGKDSVMSHRWPSHGAEPEWSSGSYCWFLLKWNLRSISITSHLLIHSESLHRSSPAKWFPNRVGAVEAGVVISYERLVLNWGWAWAEVWAHKQIAHWTSAYVRDPLASALPSSGVDFPVRRKEKNKPLKRVDSAWAWPSSFCFSNLKAGHPSLVGQWWMPNQEVVLPHTCCLQLQPHSWPRCKLPAHLEERHDFHPPQIQLSHQRQWTHAMGVIWYQCHLIRCMLPYQNILSRPQQVTPSLKFIKALKEPTWNIRKTTFKLKSNGIPWEKIMTPKLKINQIKNSKDWYLVIKMLTELVKGNTVNSDCFNKKIENIKMNQSKMTNSMAELKKKNAHGGRTHSGEREICFSGICIYYETLAAFLSKKWIPD